MMTSTTETTYARDLDTGVALAYRYYCMTMIFTIVQQTAFHLAPEGKKKKNQASQLISQLDPTLHYRENCRHWSRQSEGRRGPWVLLRHAGGNRHPMLVRREQRGIVDHRRVGVPSPSWGSSRRRRHIFRWCWWRWRDEVVHREQDGRCSRAGINGHFDGGELITACPRPHESIEISIALRLDDRLAQRLVSGLAALELGDAELGGCPVVVEVFALHPVNEGKW